MIHDNGIREASLPSAPGAALQQFVAAAARAAPVLKSWLGHVQLERNLRGEAESWLGRATDADLARAYARHFPVQGTRPEEYRNRLFETDTGQRVLTGIRFRQLDLTRPFVELIWQDRPFRNPAELERVLGAVLGAYRAFSPRYVTFFQAEPALTSWCELPGVTLQDRLLAAPVRQVAQAVVEYQERIRLQPARARAIYERYSAEYAALHASSPELRDAAGAESVAALEEAEQAGSLFEVFVAGEPAGVYALAASSRAGTGGYQVQEILLYQRFRGRGLAPAVHIAACRCAAVAQECLLWGVIGVANASSLRTALRVGRRVIGCRYRYRPPALP
jgi:hypothetical protein